MIEAMEVFTKVEEEVVGWHGTTGEEAVGHPFISQVVGEVFVVKDVDE